MATACPAPPCPTARRGRPSTSPCGSCAWFWSSSSSGSRRSWRARSTTSCKPCPDREVIARPSFLGASALLVVAVLDGAVPGLHFDADRHLAEELVPEPALADGHRHRGAGRRLRAVLEVEVRAVGEEDD